MQQLSFNEFKSLQLKEPLELTYDDEKDDAVILIRRNDKRSGNWVALPIEWEIGLPSTLYIQHLAKYCADIKVKKIIAFSPCFTSTGGIFIAEPTPANLQKIEGNFALRAYTILPDPATFQLFSDGDYYSVFVGTNDFLTQITGMNAGQGIKKFEQYVASYPLGSLEHNRIVKVLNACNDFNRSSLTFGV